MKIYSMTKLVFIWHRTEMCGVDKHLCVREFVF